MGYVLWGTRKNICCYGLPGHAQIRKEAVSFALFGTLGRFPRIPLMELDRETWYVGSSMSDLVFCEVRSVSVQVRLSYQIVFICLTANLALG